MKKQEVAAVAECNDCGSQFKVSSKNISYMRKFIVDGDEVMLTSYRCPNCNLIHFVQIDNMETLGQLKALESYMASDMVKPGNRKRSIRIKKLQIDMDAARNALMARYTGKTAHLCGTDIDYELVFSVIG